MWISNAGFADTFTFFAKIDDDKKYHWFRSKQKRIRKS